MSAIRSALICASSKSRSVGDGYRLTSARDVDEKPARRHSGQLEHPDRDRIESVKIVEKPAVEASIVEGRLKRR